MHFAFSAVVYIPVFSAVVIYREEEALGISAGVLFPQKLIQHDPACSPRSLVPSPSSPGKKGFCGLLSDLGHRGHIAGRSCRRCIATSGCPMSPVYNKVQIECLPRGSKRCYAFAKLIFIIHFSQENHGSGLNNV